MKQKLTDIKGTYTSSSTNFKKKPGGDHEGLERLTAHHKLGPVCTWQGTAPGGRQVFFRSTHRTLTKADIKQTSTNLRGPKPYGVDVLPELH